MAGNIKGIIVEIGGDTSGLQNALKKLILVHLVWAKNWEELTLCWN